MKFVGFLITISFLLGSVFTGAINETSINPALINQEQYTTFIVLLNPEVNLSSYIEKIKSQRCHITRIFYQFHGFELVLPICRDVNPCYSDFSFLCTDCEIRAFTKDERVEALNNREKRKRKATRTTETSSSSREETTKEKPSKHCKSESSDKTVPRLTPVCSNRRPSSTMPVHCRLQLAGAPWGLNRLNTFSKFEGDDKYKYPSTCGTGADVYIFDTGMDINNPQFGTRAEFGKNFVLGESDDDLSGHGTMVAGVVGSLSYGVAKNVKLISVKVLDRQGQGTISGVIAGLDWALELSQQTKKPSIFVLGLGGSFNTVFNIAADISVQKGAHVIVGAGNHHSDACGFSPASAPKVITIAASDSLDRAAQFSNFGKCVNIYAPGTGVLTTFPRALGSWTAMGSGTSFATGYVAGIAALYLVLPQYKDITPQELAHQIVKNGQVGALLFVPSDTPNILASTIPLLRSLKCTPL